MREEVERVWQNSSTSVDQTDGFNGGHGGGPSPGSGPSSRLPHRSKLRKVGDPMRIVNPATGVEEPLSNLSSGKVILEEPITNNVHLTTPLSNLNAVERQQSNSVKDTLEEGSKYKIGGGSGLSSKKLLSDQIEIREGSKISPREGVSAASVNQKVQPTLIPYEVPQTAASKVSQLTTKDEILRDPQNAIKPPVAKRRESQYTGQQDPMAHLAMSTAGFLPPSQGMTRAEKERFEELRLQVESLKQNGPTFSSEIGELKSRLRPEIRHVRRAEPESGDHVV